jgi:hypothetical protein
MLRRTQESTSGLRKKYCRTGTLPAVWRKKMQPVVRKYSVCAEAVRLNPSFCWRVNFCGPQPGVLRIGLDYVRIGPAVQVGSDLTQKFSVLVSVLRQAQAQRLVDQLI